MSVLLISVLTGCGDDDSSESTGEPAAGVDGNVGNIAVRDMFVLGGQDGRDIPAGGSAPVYLTLINQPATVETAGASPSGADVLVGVSSPGAGSGRILGEPVRAPVGQDVTVGPQAKVVLTDVTRPLAAGENITVSLKFEHAGAGSFNVPVQSPEDGLETYSPAPSE